MKIDKRLSNVEEDVEDIKDWKSNLTGKISIIGAVAGTVMGIVSSIIVALFQRKI